MRLFHKILRPTRLVLLFVFAVGPCSAAAHGAAAPDTHMLVSRGGSSTEMIAETTFGLLLSTDTGGNWSWICEEALGVRGGQHVDVHFAKGGDIWVAAFEGVFQSTNGGCDWAARSEFADSGASDVFGLESEPTVLYVTTSRYGIVNKLFRSTDSGASFHATLTRDKSFLTSVRVAPSNALRVYVAGWWFEPTNTSQLYRSDDGGDSFVEIDFTTQLPAAGPFFVWAVHPTNPNVLYASVNTTDVTPKTYFLRSDNGGTTFTQAFEVDAPISSVLLSDDGETVWAASSLQVFRSRDGGATFQAMASPKKNGCVGKLGEDIYVCGAQGPDGWVIGKSTTGSAPFSPVLKLNEVKSWLSCPLQSDVAKVCEPAWPSLETLLTLYSDTGDPYGPDAGTTGTPAPRGCGCGANASMAWLLAMPFVQRLLKGRGP